MSESATDNEAEGMSVSDTRSATNLADAIRAAADVLDEVELVYDIARETDYWDYDTLVINGKRLQSERYSNHVGVENIKLTDPKISWEDDGENEAGYMDVGGDE